MSVPLLIGLLLNPGLLALGGALVAVPILIHLLNRRRVQPMPWAAMQWLLAAMRRHQRRLRIENWLILLLRIAAVLLLGLALARPVITNPALAGIVAGKRSVYLVLDTSYSMLARSEGRAVLDIGKAEATNVLSGMGADDALGVFVTNDPRADAADGRQPYALIPRTVGRDAGSRAKEAVAALRGRDAPANWTETLRLVLSQTVREDVNRLVVLVTDLQARDWKDPDVVQALDALIASPAAVRILDVGGTDRRNLTVAEVKSARAGADAGDRQIAPATDAFVSLPWDVEVTVENQGPRPVEGARLTVSLDGDATPLAVQILERLAGTDPQTGEPGSVSTLIHLPPRSFGSAGSHVLTAAVTPPPEDPGADCLGLDSRRGLALDVRDRVHVVAWTHGSKNANLGPDDYLRGVYERWDVDASGRRTQERTSRYDMRTVPSESALVDALDREGGEGVDLVVLANVLPRGRAVEALRSWVRAGGALLYFVGDRVLDVTELNKEFFQDPTTRLLPFPFDTPEIRHQDRDAKPFAIDLEKDTGHALAAPFTGEQAQAWIGQVPPRIWGRIPFREEAPNPSDGDTGSARPEESERARKVVLRFRDGRPAVVQGSLGLGRTLWVGTSIDHGWFDQSLPFFLPVLLDEAALWLTRPDATKRNLEVGRPIVVTWLTRDATRARFIAPGGAEIVPKRIEGLHEADRPEFLEDLVGVAGTWTLRYEREGLRGETRNVEESFAVNADPGEGRLGAMDHEQLLASVPPESNLRIASSWEDVEGDAKDVEQGEISAEVLWALLGLLVLEAVLAWTFGRKRAAQTQSAAVGGRP